MEKIVYSKKLIRELFSGKKVTVMGLGLSGGGLGVTKWLASQGAKILVTDLKSRNELKKSLERLKGLPIEYVLGRHREKDFKNRDLIIQNPGVSSTSKFLKTARENKIPIETDISLFFKLCPVPIIGITGTKGKSTTTALIGEIFFAESRFASGERESCFKTFVGGNIGRSPFEYLNQADVKMLECLNVKMILELSSFQLEGMERIKKSPHLAVITNIYPDHLNRYRDMKGYIDAKKNIFEYQGPEDFVILNYDNKIVRALAKGAPSQKYFFSKNTNPHKLEHEFARMDWNGAFVRDGHIIFRGKGKEERVCLISDIKLQGEHNLENILAAVTVAMICRVEPKIICKVLKDFQGIPNRLELIKTINGVRYYNDTTATTPEATMAALVSFEQLKIMPIQHRHPDNFFPISIFKLKEIGIPIHRENKNKKSGKNIALILGGRDKELNFEKLGKFIAESGQIKKIILLKHRAYNASRKIFRVLKKYKLQYKIVFAFDLREAVLEAQKSASLGDIVLFSPGAASFGMFQNEFERGERFREEVKRL